MARVLVVDDEPNMRWVLQEALTKAGHAPHTAGSGSEALALLANTPIDLVILDLKLKGIDGLATLQAMHQRWPEVVVIILTAYGTVATAVTALQSGAADYLRKPFDVEEILFKITRALERQMLQQEIQRLRSKTPDLPPGSHLAWRRVVEVAAEAIRQDFDLRLIGESGSGRATIARYAHAAGPRRKAPLVELDLETLPAEQQASILEGSSEQDGAWAKAGQGALLLRHLHALSLNGAAALARLVQRRTDQQHGPLLLTTEPADYRPPQLTVPENRRRAEVRVPPLREHLDDLLLLAQFWLGDTAIAPAASNALHAYSWPGNIAELRGVLERAAALAHGAPIEERHLSANVCAAPLANEVIRLPPEGLNLETVEVALIRQALVLAGGNKSRAAELLGLTRHTLLYRLEKYSIEG
ncbi:MAG: response regulator [Chloroflexales bacterium]|nr:response regulator [Chloroflexales bacterium]